MYHIHKYCDWFYSNVEAIQILLFVCHWTETLYVHIYDTPAHQHTRHTPTHQQTSASMYTMCISMFKCLTHASAYLIGWRWIFICLHFPPIHFWNTKYNCNAFFYASQARLDVYKMCISRTFRWWSSFFNEHEWQKDASWSLFNFRNTSFHWNDWFFFILILIFLQLDKYIDE